MTYPILLDAKQYKQLLNDYDFKDSYNFKSNKKITLKRWLENENILA